MPEADKYNICRLFENFFIQDALIADRGYDKFLYGSRLNSSRLL